MVAAAGRVDLGRPPELAEGQDHRAAEQPPPLQVLEQGRVGVVEVGPDLVLVALDRAERRRAVDVPGDLVEDGLEHVDGDEPHAPLDQAAGQQAALPEAGPAVAVADRGGLRLQVERLAGRLARHQPIRLVEVGVEQAGVGRGLEGADGAVDGRAERAAALLADGRQVVGREEVGHAERLVVGVGVQDERVERLAQVAGPLAVRHVAPRRADRAGEQDVRRDLPPRPLQLRQGAAVVRVLDPAAEEAAGLHHLVAGVVDGRRRVVDRADQRHLVHLAGQLREDLADLDARHAGRDRPERPADLLGRVGLHVPGVELRRPADQEQQDAVDVAVPRHRPPRLQRLHPRQAQPEPGERAGVEEVATGQPVAEVDRPGGVDADHARDLAR